MHTICNRWNIYIIHKDTVSLDKHINKCKQLFQMHVKFGILNIIILSYPDLRFIIDLKCYFDYDIYRGHIKCWHSCYKSSKRNL